ncbi:MAG: type IV pilus modification PilV family protein [Candidatus Muiribacteriota bacterium]
MLKNNDSGFTIIEVLFAIALFSVGLFALSMTQGHFAKGLSDSRNIVHATDAAMAKVEELSNITDPLDSAFNTGGHNETKNIGNRAYNIQWNVVDNGNLTLEIIITVSWTEGGKNHSLSFPWVKGL